MDHETESLLTRAVDLERQLSEVRFALAGLPPERLEGRPLEVLVCRSEATDFAVAVEQVDEVIPNVATVELPGVESWVRGAIDVEGVLVPVVDVAARLGAAPLPSRVDDVLVLCRSQDRRLALRVTEVPSLQRVEAGALVPLPADQGEAPCVAGCVTLDLGSIPLISVFSLSLASNLAREAT